MLSRHELMILWGTGTYAEQVGRMRRMVLWRLYAQHPPTAPGQVLGNDSFSTGRIITSCNIWKITTKCSSGLSFQRKMWQNQEEWFYTDVPSCVNPCEFFQWSLPRRLTVYSNNDRVPTFSKITLVEFALRTSSVTHIRKTNHKSVKARLSYWAKVTLWILLVPL